MLAQRHPLMIVRCGGCSILIGPGYLSERGHPAPDGRGVLCDGCARALESVARRGGDPLRALGRWRRELQRPLDEWYRPGRSPMQ